RLRAVGQEYFEGLLAVVRLSEHETEREVRQQIAVAVDVEPVNGVVMERVGIRIGVEDDHGSRRIRVRLERIQIAQVESLVAERRTEAQSGEMIRHSFASFRDRGIRLCKP